MAARALECFLREHVFKTAAAGGGGGDANEAATTAAEEAATAAATAAAAAAAPGKEKEKKKKEKKKVRCENCDREAAVPRPDDFGSKAPAVCCTECIFSSAEGAHAHDKACDARCQPAAAAAVPEVAPVDVGLKMKELDDMGLEVRGGRGGRGGRGDR